MARICFFLLTGIQFVFGFFISCSLPQDFCGTAFNKEVEVYVELPQWPPQDFSYLYPELAEWKIHVEGPGEVVSIEKHEDAVTRVQLKIKNKAAVVGVTAYPITKNQNGEKFQFFYP